MSGDVGVRVRLTDEALQGGASPTGPASSGEVEDYLVRTTQPVSLGSFVWSDTNGDGVQTSGEPGIPGAVVRLLDANSNAALDVFGNAVAPVVTGKNGFYDFNNLAAGDYRVEVTPPAGYTPTVSVATPNNNDNTDSNGVPLASGSVVRSGVVTLAPEPAGG